ncbi:hypothetical protein F2P81_013825 [Scophthalmus maximus]|uniref:Uncharacterized protein n=1 Tax=Scophthalmus maximus TaxID=52904 RepID=A0A6A4SMB1_SCOMX|nr:hypothetical protein F2P81_013825 [Scophthalmus maximus]
MARSWLQCGMLKVVSTMYVYGAYTSAHVNGVIRSPFSCLIPSPFALFAEEGVKWFSEGSYLMHPPPPPPPLLLSGPALLNMLQHGQKARLRVTATESGSVFVDKLYLNRADPSDYRTVCEINMYVPSAELGSDSVFRQ